MTNDTQREFEADAERASAFFSQGPKKNPDEEPGDETRRTNTPETSGKNTEYAAGGHALPSNWLMRIALIWGGYAVSAFAGNAASYSGIWFVTESTGSPLALALLYVLAFLPMGLLSPLGGVIAAPALGILLYTSFGLQASLLLGGIGSAVAVATMFFAKLPQIEPSARKLGPWASLKEGAAALSAQRGLLILTIGVSLGMLAYGPIDSLLPLMVSQHFHGDGFAASLLAAVMGIGMLLGSLALMVVNPTKKLARIIVASSLIVGTSALASGFIPETGYWLFVGCIGVLAVACAWFNAPLMTLLQKGIPEEKLGRVIGLFTAMNGLAIPVGTAMGGTLAEFTGTPLFFSIDGAFIIALGLAIAFSKHVRALK